MTIATKTETELVAHAKGLHAELKKEEKQIAKLKKVLGVKQQSLNALVQQAGAAWDRADKEQKSADDWAVRTGKLLVELKARIKAEGGSWLETLEKMGRGERRAQELMQLAGGEVTIEDQRERNNTSKKAARARRKSAGRPADNSNKKDTPTLSVVDEDEYVPEEDSSEQRAGWSLGNLFGDILSRAPHLDRLYPGWRNFDFPSDLQTLGKDAATELASLLKTIGVK